MKVDLKKDIPSYRARKGVFEIVEVPPLRYLMIDGHGDPNTQAFEEALTTLYSVAYPLKFLSKKELDRDYVVMPLEALWWADDMEAFTLDRDKSRWDWTAMILTPDWITDEQFSRVVSNAKGPALERTPPRDARGGHVRAGASCRTVRRRGSGALAAASRVHPGARASDDGQAPRDLLRRPPAAPTPRSCGRSCVNRWWRLGPERVNS